MFFQMKPNFLTPSLMPQPREAATTLVAMRGRHSGGNAAKKYFIHRKNAENKLYLCRIFFLI